MPREDQGAMLPDETCPICLGNMTEPNGSPSGRTDAWDCDCTRCGSYTISGTAYASLPLLVADVRWGREILSHVIRRRQFRERRPFIDHDQVKMILKTKLPRPPEQTAYLILWLGDSTPGIGEMVR